MDVIGDTTITGITTINGNLTVTGSTTTVDTTNLTVKDNLIVLSRDNTNNAASTTSGLIIENSDVNRAIVWDKTKFKFVETNSTGDDPTFTTGNGSDIEVKDVYLNAINSSSNNTNADITITPNGTGSVIITSKLDVSGDTSVSTLDSSGATSLATGGGAVNISKSGVMTTVKGTLNVDEAVTLDTTLDVTGDTSVSTLDSSGATSLATGGGVVNISKSGVMTTVKGTLNVDEAVTLDTTLDVTGATRYRHWILLEPPLLQLEEV